jgi:hypothetical protein
MRLKRTRSRLAIGAMVALVASVTTAASASAQAGDDHYAVLVDPMTSDAPEDGGSIHVDTVRRVRCRRRCPSDRPGNGF